MSREGEKYHVQKGGGVNIVFRPKFKPSEKLYPRMTPGQATSFGSLYVEPDPQNWEVPVPRRIGNMEGGDPLDHIFGKIDIYRYRS